MIYIAIILLIISFIFFLVGLLKKQKTDINNKQIDEENKKLLEVRKNIVKDINTLRTQEENENQKLIQIKNLTQDMNAATRDSFREYANALEQNYNQKEQEYDKLLENLKQSYDAAANKYRLELGEIKYDLDKISATRAAALEAKRKEQEIKDKQAFYCPQIAENDLKDAKILKDIEYKLNNPRILRMLIWTTYYQKPMNQVCANVLGGATASKCGIYKITNQLDDTVYIGQSLDIATRWKNHAKAGLGIDTPANNRLYKAMQKDGLENFSFEVLEECAAAALNEKEKFYIQLYQADQFGYNGNKGIG